MVVKCEPLEFAYVGTSVVQLISAASGSAETTIVSYDVPELC